MDQPWPQLPGRPYPAQPRRGWFDDIVDLVTRPAWEVGHVLQPIMPPREVEYRGKRRPTGVGMVTPGIAPWTRGFAPTAVRMPRPSFSDLILLRGAAGLPGMQDLQRTRQRRKR
jgi:hypothetical protein